MFLGTKICGIGWVLAEKIKFEHAMMSKMGEYLYYLEGAGIHYVKDTASYRGPASWDICKAASMVSSCLFRHDNGID
jgi:hypothetical protein